MKYKDTSYRDTAEYAFDVLEHEYHNHIASIEAVGVDNIIVLVPEEFKDKLKASFWKDGTIKYTIPNKYRGIEIKYCKIDKPLFTLKKTEEGRNEGEGIVNV